MVNAIQVSSDCSFRSVNLLSVTETENRECSVLYEIIFSVNPTTKDLLAIDKYIKDESTVGLFLPHKVNVESITFQRSMFILTLFEHYLNRCIPTVLGS